MATRKKPARASKATVTKAKANAPTSKKQAKKPVAKKLVAKKPVAKKPGAKKPVAKKPVAKKPVAKKPGAKKPGAKKPGAKKPGAKKPGAKKPGAKKPVAKKPVAKTIAQKPVPAKQATKPAPPKPVVEKALPVVDLWRLIEDAWSEVAPELAAARANPSEDNMGDLDEGAEGMLEALRETLDALDKEALLAVDRALEQALYKIDRADIQEVTDGSDDGFLYARGFIVAMGKRFYDAVDENPTRAISDAECEDICYLPFHLYKEKFGEPPPSAISRESCSNSDEW